MLIKPKDFMKIDDTHYKTTYKALTPTAGGKKKEEVVFDNMGELFVYGCIIGFIENEHKPIEKGPKSQPIRWEFIKPKHQALLLAIAVQKIGNLESLKDAKKIRETLEAYSNGGLYAIQKKMNLQDILFTDIEGIINELSDRWNN